jgi:hypothetical protein
MRRGMKFLHSRQIVEIKGKPCREWPAETCEVTAVRQGVIYYRNSTGYREYVTVERFPDICSAVLTD